MVDRTRFIEAINKLSDDQISVIEVIVDRLTVPYTIFSYNESAGFFSESFAKLFGDFIKIHHALSREPFSKDKFEYALTTVLNKVGIESSLAPKGNPGYDVTIEGKHISLKTQADKDIKEGKLWISKFMELGKGDWTNQIAHLIGLREQFFKHLEGYEKIMQLRCLSNNKKLYGENEFHYQLLEIPKEVLFESRKGKFTFSEKSKAKETDARPATCKVYDANKDLKFQLYFDGMGERKLHIQHLNTKYCIKHGEWRFSY